jgi:hypothetical protein
MAEITLADYTGYIFLEIIKAREMADRHSRQLAEVYAQDPVLRHFSVPRFKVPKMELTIPVLISGARFNQVINFKMPRDKFVAYTIGRLKEVVSVVRSRGEDPFTRPPVVPVAVAKANLGGSRRSARGVANLAPALAPVAIEGVAIQFWQQLKDNPDPSQPSEIVRRFWTPLFEQALVEQDLMQLYKKTNPGNELFRQSLDEVLKVVMSQTVIDSTSIQSLLINPETNVVKNGSSDTSVFTLKADLLEEGFFIRTVRDEATGQTRPVVEFE